MTDTHQELIDLYKQLADMTKPLCASACRVPRSCCSLEYCLMAIQIAKEEWNIELQDTGSTKLPLMGPEGCVAPPHVRPLCAAHVCEGTLMRQSPEFQDEYFKIRDRISALEFQKEDADRNAI